MFFLRQLCCSAAALLCSRCQLNNLSSFTFSLSIENYCWRQHEAPTFINFPQIQSRYKWEGRRKYCDARLGRLIASLSTPLSHQTHQQFRLSAAVLHSRPPSGPPAARPLWPWNRGNQVTVAIDRCFGSVPCSFSSLSTALQRCSAPRSAGDDNSYWV